MAKKKPRATLSRIWKSIKPLAIDVLKHRGPKLVAEMILRIFNVK